MPPTNSARRQALADAAIDLLAVSGVHGVTHRAVEKAAGLPPGTASNYFRSREALLVAAAERTVELHHADMDQAAAEWRKAGTANTASVPAAAAEHIAGLLADSLLQAATMLRDRYLAIFELQLEAVRRPALASALAALQDNATRLTAGHHVELGLPIPPEKISTLVTLYGGALFTLVTAPPETINESLVHNVAHTIVQAVIPELR